MARPQTKQELLTQAQANFDRLLDRIVPLSEEEMSTPGVNETWAIKDILTHLTVWHEMCLNWYQVGLTGEKPEIPAPGFTWHTTPALNEKIFQDNRHKDPHAALEELNTSHQQIMALIDSHTNEELFTKKLYKWTGTSSLGSYLVSCSSSHYDWAYKLIHKWLRNRAIG